MTTKRQAVVKRRVSPVSVTKLIKRRVNPKQVPVTGSETGSVVKMPWVEDFAISMLKASPRQASEFRSNEYLHVSDLLGGCLRKMALSDKYNTPMPHSMVSDSMGITFAIGTAIHDYVKAKVKEGHPDKMFGVWSCQCGAVKSKPSTLAKVERTVCGKCGTSVGEKYHELELRDDELMLVGSPDIVLYMGKHGAYHVIEVKSITHDQWKELVRPKPDHVLQGLFYWYLLRKLGYPVSDTVSVLYVDKGYVFGSPYKEFTIDAEPNIHRLDDYIAEAMARVASKANGGIPPRVICKAPGQGQAKTCHMAMRCFMEPA